jgi:D-glycero-D-manno-heptose 1,7-bisphosphate phosphatase
MRSAMPSSRLWRQILSFGLPIRPAVVYLRPPFVPGLLMCRNRALFLDRDGVINEERCYVHSPEAFEFQEGIFDLCRAAQRLGYLLIVVTNQAGIARGYYSEDDFLRLTEWMTRQFAEQGIHLSRVYYCPYHPLHGLGDYRRDSPDRKPNPGMLLRAQADFDLDLRSSILIGDKMSDIEAGNAAGIGTTVLLRQEALEMYSRQAKCHVFRSLVDIRTSFFFAV